MLSPTIETERLVLRRYRESDIDMQYQILTDKRLATFIKFPELSREEELEIMKKWIKEANHEKCEKWVITLKQDGSENIPIGNISVTAINKKNNYCDMGYVILYEYWGNGYATEAATAVSDYLLKERKYYLVEASCNEHNKASISVLLKAGFVKDGYVRNRRINQDGSYSGVEYYGKQFPSDN